MHDGSRGHRWLLVLLLAATFAALSLAGACGELRPEDDFVYVSEPEWQQAQKDLKDATTDASEVADAGGADQTAPVDAGTKADVGQDVVAVPDSQGIADAQVDAQSDAGAVDGGPADGGPVDGGSVDGGPGDVLEEDAGSDGGADAGADAAMDASDVSQPDAGKPACALATQASDCDDNDVCTDDLCKAGVCSHPTNPGACDDEDVCTDKDACQDGKCVGLAIDVTATCGDGNVCTVDTCDAKDKCKHAPLDNLCDDGDACTAGDSCKDSKCVAGAAPDCNDGKVCTDDSCDPAKGCQHTANAAACDDGQPCTNGDLCVGGQCESGPNCCTCASDGDCADKEDGNLCNGTLYCAKTNGCSACVLDLPSVVTCDSQPAVPCQTAVCDPKDGKCKAEAADAGKVCDDGSACTQATKCVDGSCSGQTVKCGDDNACTDDSCDPKKGCLNVHNTMACDDGDVCTVKDVCTTGKCTAGPAKVCDDDDPCTIDACDKGCTASPASTGAPCKLQGIDGTCKAKKCVPSGPTDLDLDHDGLSGAADPCPTTWNPDGDAKACAVWNGSGWNRARSVKLSQGDKGSTWWRSNEPVEVPLANGLIDASVVAHYRLDGNGTDSSAAANHAAAAGAAEATTGAFGDPGGAMLFKGGCYKGKKNPQLEFGSGDFTIMLWFKRAPMGDVPFDYENVFGFRDKAEEGFGVYIYDKDNATMGAGRIGLWMGKDCGVTGTLGPVDNNQWHHIAFVRTAGSSKPQLWLNGRLAVSKGKLFAETCDLSDIASISAIAGESDDCGTTTFKGALDDVVLFNRALSPTELGVYYRTRAPYGTSFVAGAQADFDDLRVTGTTPWQESHATHFELLGPRPHSDTDLTGVVGYWPLNGDTKSNSQDAGSGTYGGVGKGAGATKGRFGDYPGGLKFAGDGGLYVWKGRTLKLNGDFTVEVWARMAKQTGGRQVLVQTAWGAKVNNNGFMLEHRDDTKKGLYAGIHGKGGAAIFSGVRMDDSNWHHVAIVRQGASFTLYLDAVALASDTVGAATDGGNDLTIGYQPGALPTSQLNGAVDELIVHNVAKSADYIAKRALGLPRVRFLAHTSPVKAADGTFAFHEYNLHWENKGAQALSTRVVDLDQKTECDALLSPCLGYAGWWRLDEGQGVYAHDESSLRTGGQIVGGPATSWGQSGAALTFDGKDDHIAVANNTALTLSAYTMEATFLAMTQNDGHEEHHVLSKGDKTPYAGQLEVWKGNLRFWIDKKEDDYMVVSPKPVVAGQWLSAASSFDGKTLRLFGAHEQVASKAVFAVASQGAGALHLGASKNGALFDANRFLGSLDEVRLMRRPLSADEQLHHPLASWSLGQPESMIPVPAGDFWMGCNAAASDVCVQDELPQHRVVLAAYAIDRYEVTVQEYGVCVAANACGLPKLTYDSNATLNWNGPGRDSYPINGVTWAQATAYCKWVGKRLPTEAEWEKAARGGCELYAGKDCKALMPTYPWGSDAPACKYAYFNDPKGGGPGCGKNSTGEVGKRILGVSPYGVHDLIGNAREWLADYYAADYYSKSSPANPNGPATGTERVVRGGAWSDGATDMRASRRTKASPLDAGSYGFRCVKGELSCDDGDPCTADSKDAAGKCVIKVLADGDACEDGDACTHKDTCKTGKCAAGPVKSCTDGNDCTTDSCDKSKGCAHKNNTASCSDGSACTEADKCDGGSCKAGPPKTCAATAWPCHVSACDAQSGQCVAKLAAEGIACGDGGGKCASGNCQATDKQGRQWGLVPAGSYYIGCNAALDNDCLNSEKPQAKVSITKPFWLGMHEVTASNYVDCISAGKCTAADVEGKTTVTCKDIAENNWTQSGAKAGRSLHPANCVKWAQAEDYCQWAGGHLPTEAQWELAARGRCEENGGDCAATMRVYPWGNTPPTCGKQGVFDSGGAACGLKTTWAVGTGSASGPGPYGHRDLAGNVAEWAYDYWHTSFYGLAMIKLPDPKNTVQSSLGTIRGGSFVAIKTQVRASWRKDFPTGLAAARIGFRCARNIPPCDDNDPCTVDSADSAGKCTHVQAPDGSVCGDGVCKSGTCVAPWLAVAAGGMHACALRSGGAVWCWGANEYGELGNGTKSDSSPPAAAKNLIGIKAIAVGAYHSCAVKGYGLVNCWGQNSVGQLGDGTNQNRPLPGTVKGLTDIASIASLDAHTCAVDIKGAVFCWGKGTNGQLGDGNLVTSSTAVAVKDLPKALAVSTGGNHSCAVVDGGAVMCWGAQTYGQLGDGVIAQLNQPKPVAVKGLSGAKALASGFGHTCAVRGDGTVACWGYNKYGSLGNGTNDDSGSFVAPTGLAQVKVLSAGYHHNNCAIDANGIVSCWGYNVSGVFGDGTDGDQNKPMVIKNLAGFAAIGTGYMHSCGITAAATVSCWGDNTKGQFGQLGIVSKTPVAVKLPK